MCGGSEEVPEMANSKVLPFRRNGTSSTSRKEIIKLFFSRELSIYVPVADVMIITAVKSKQPSPYRLSLHNFKAA